MGSVVSCTVPRIVSRIRIFLLCIFLQLSLLEFYSSYMRIVIKKFLIIFVDERNIAEVRFLNSFSKRQRTDIGTYQTRTAAKDIFFSIFC